MADDAAQIQVDAIVQAISFGIVSDFRDLRQAMSDVAYQTQENNRLLGETNVNLYDVERSLDQIEKDVYRRKDSRQFKQLEDKLERKSRYNTQRSEDMLNRIMSAVESIRSSGGVDRSVNYQQTTRQNGQDQADTPSTSPSSQSATKAPGVGAAIAGTAAIAAGVAATGAMTQGSEAPANLAPASPSPAQTPPAPSRPAASLTPQAAAPAQIANQLVSAGNANFSQSSLSSSAATAAQSVGAVTTTSKQKAASKVIPKVPNWLSRNGAKIENVVGSANMYRFGVLVGNNFSFRKFMSSDAWTVVGAEYVAGKTPPMDSSTEAGYVASVTTTLAIQTYLIAREIYTEENFVSIENGIVPNFDDLDPAIRTQVVKDVGNQVESYLNRLISSSAGAAAAPSTPSSTTQSTTKAASAAAVTAAAGGAGAGESSGQTTPAPAGTGGAPPSPTYEQYKNMPMSSGMSVAPKPGAVPTNDGKGMMSVAPKPGPQILSTPQQGVTGSDQLERESSAYTSGAESPLGTFSTRSNVAGGTGSDHFDDMASTYMPRLMQDFDLTEEQAAGIIGNLGHESAGMQAGIQERSPRSGRGGLGWAQWTGPRRRQFEAFLSENGMSADDPEANYAFLKHELSTTEAGALEAVRNTRDARSATIAFEKSYERAGVKAYGSRLEYTSRGLAVMRAKAESDGAIQPLPSEAAESTDLSRELAPPTSSSPYYGSEDESSDTTSSEVTNPIDNRNRTRVEEADPKEQARNQISNYYSYMDHVFGVLGDELKTHMTGEVTEDALYEQSMHALA